MTAQPNVTLTLPRRVVDSLADCGHIPGYPHRVADAVVPDWDPDRDLHRAAASWFLASRPSRYGRRTAEVTAAQATEIVRYVESVAGSMSSPGSGAKAEGRALRGALDTVVKLLRAQPGVTVRETRRPYWVDYAVEVTTS